MRKAKLVDKHKMFLTSHERAFHADSIINSGYCSVEEKSTSTLHWDSCRVQSIHRSCAGENTSRHGGRDQFHIV